jgi:regulator of sigma E protease
MELLLGVQGAFSWVLHWILPFIVVLSVVVVIHELGHFLVGRLFGAKVDSFSIGFGPEIFSRKDRYGTKWRVAWLPLGGYVKFFGDMGPASEPDPKALAEYERAGLARDEIFHFKPLYQRALIIAAGPVANFILAIFIFAGVYMFAGELQAPARIDGVDVGGVGEAAGFEVGDVIVEIEGRRIKSFTDVQRIVNFSADIPLTFVVQRGDEMVNLTATPLEEERTDRFGNVHKLGIIGLSGPMYDEFEMVRYGPITAFGKGVGQTVDIVTQTFVYLGRVISGRQDADQLGGPLRIAQVSGQVASIDAIALIHLIGILSVSIGLVNLFPIPILDGGHLVFYGYEAIAGKPLGEGAQEVGFRVGLVLVLAMMIFATWNDLVHLQVFEFLEGMFS